MAVAEYHPFAILTPRLVILPTPSAVKQPDYRILYSRLHALPDFCTMAFGSQYPLRAETSDEETEAWINVEVVKNWQRTGMGDFAVGIWVGKPFNGGRLIQDHDGAVKISIIEGPEVETVIAKQVKWIGYVGVRDPIPRLPAREPEDKPLPHWLQMIEIRYGFTPSQWGKGYGTEAAKGLMLWAEMERGVRRFIAETERENSGSANILKKMGFVELRGNEYWKEESEIEWERYTGGLPAPA